VSEKSVLRGLFGP